MSGCRIGKVKPKKGGATVHLLPSNRTHFHETIENAAKCINEDTHLIAFVVMDKIGSVSCGCSHGDDFTPSQLRGACEQMKDDLIYQIWEEEE
jgi:hypothetical protein